MLYLPGLSLDRQDAQNLLNGRGVVYRNLVDPNSGDYTPTATFVQALFPPPEPPQEPPIDREIDLLEITAVGPIRGTIDFDGFAYDAELALEK